MQSLLLRKKEKSGWANTLAVWIYGGYAWTIFGLAVIVFGGLSILLCHPTLGRRVARRGARLVFHLAGLPISVSGTSRLPEEAHVIVVNHASFLDGIALIALLPEAPGYAFVVRQQFRSQALLYPLLKSLGTLVLHRVGVEPTIPDVDRMVALLRSGERLVVFPEGGFRPEPGLQAFHSGAFVAATSAGVPVVPAALHGTREALPAGTWLPRCIPIRLEIGSVLYPVDGDWESVVRMTSLAQTAVSTMLNEESGGR